MAGRSKSKTTTDRDQIRHWLEARRGRPAVVKSTRGKGDDKGVLRIDFPGYSGAGSLEEISWVKFFEKFDRKGHALGTRETAARGQRSNFKQDRLSRETVTARAAGNRSGASRVSRSRAGKTGARKSTGRKAAKRGSRSW